MLIENGATLRFAASELLSLAAHEGLTQQGRQQPDVRSQDIIHARVGSGRGRGCHGTIVSHPWLAPGDLRNSLR